VTPSTEILVFDFEFFIGARCEFFDIVPLYVKDWVEKRIRRHLMHARKRQGFGWNRWSKDWLYRTLGLYGDYQVRYVARVESAANP
jgi:hypothetical protein